MKSYTEAMAFLMESPSRALKAILSSRKKNRSSIDVGKNLRIEPYCVISKDIVNHENINGVKTTLTKLFASYHMIATSSMMMVEKASITKVMDSLSPNKDIDSFVRSMESSNDYLYNEDEYRYGLPNERKSQFTTTEGVSFAPSSFKDHPTGIAIDMTVSSAETGIESQKLPILYLMRYMPVEESWLKDLMSSNPVDTSSTDKLYKLDANRGSYIKDILLSKELIRKKQRVLMGDTQSIYRDAIDQARKGHAYSMFSSTFNPITASTVYIISKKVAKSVEREMGGSLSSMKTRARIFEGALAMMIAVIDSEWDTLTIYYEGIAAPSVLTLSTLEKKSGDANIMDLFKTLKGGNAAIL